MKCYVDSDIEKKWISKEHLEYKLPVYFIIRLMYCDAWSKEWAQEQGKYHVEIHAVSLTAATPHVNKVCESYGVPTSEFNALDNVGKCDMIDDYGIFALLWQDSGNNQRRLLTAAHKELVQIQAFFEQHMDRPQNAIGWTGWDTIKGGRI